MRLVVFGLSISSSWGNGHATLWRGLCRSLARLGHSVVFFERNRSYYETARDWRACANVELVLYDGWWAIRDAVARELRNADVAIVTSYCPDAVAACEAAHDFPHVLRVFYDLDTPVTLSNLQAGRHVPYLSPDGLRDYELVLSYTGGSALDQLQSTLGAPRVAPLYGHVDPELHRPVRPVERYRADLSYLGTYAADRQEALESLFVAPARARPRRRFVMGGAQYPDSFPWSSNVYFVRHLPPDEHAAFYSSSRLTLNVTRAAMADLGWCPSGRLFEAAACRTALVTDDWPGLSDFYEPGREVLLAHTTEDALAALDASDAELARIAQRAYERTLAEHTSHRRAKQLLAALEDASSGRAHASPPPPRRAADERLMSGEMRH
jgi:spore maturation protein CgeB